MSRRILPFVILLLILTQLASIGCRAEPGSTEVPLLAPRVEAGELPPVAERLPSEPALVEPVEGQGRYGGSLRLLDADPDYWSLHLLGQAGLFRYDPLGLDLTPDLAAGYSLSEDGRVLELRLRPGHKWSDGQPFTSADVLFWWEAYANHPAFAPEAFWQFEEGAMQVEAVDAQTLRFEFPVPYPVVLDRWGRALLATDGLRGPILPRHHLERYHLDYNPDAGALAAAEGLDSWQELFEKHADAARSLDPERPSLWMWIPEELAEGAVTMVRNPYFHQVDTRGRQLPYIDRIEARHVDSRTAFVEAVVAGEADLESFYIGAYDLPALQELAEGQALRLVRSLETSLYTIHFNLNAAEPLQRALFGQLDFRRALSLAIDREAIAEEIFEGHARPSPAMPLEQHDFYDEAWTEPLIRHDPAAAQALLDGIGLTERDENGFRLRSDGLPVKLRMQMHNDGQRNRAVCEAIQGHWELIGIASECRATSVPQLNQWWLDNELQLAIWGTTRTTRLLRTDPRWFGFFGQGQQWWAPLWTQWIRSGGAEGERPPEEILALDEQFHRWQALPYESPEAMALAREYFGWFAQNQPMIGTVGLQDHPMVVADRLRGLPEGEVYWSADANFYTPYLPAQWWLEE